MPYVPRLKSVYMRKWRESVAAKRYGQYVK